MVISLTIHWKDATGRERSCSVNMGHHFAIPQPGDSILTPDDGTGDNQHLVKVERRQLNYQYRGGADLTVFVNVWCSLPASSTSPD